MFLGLVVVFFEEKKPLCPWAKTFLWLCSLGGGCAAAQQLVGHFRIKLKGGSVSAGNFPWDHSQWHLFRVFTGLRDKMGQEEHRFIPRGAGGCLCFRQ